MVKQFWRWLIRLIQPLLPPFLKQKRHRRVKRQRLSDADYQQLFEQLLTGVNQGWNSEEVFQHLGHRMNDRYFKAWLREYGKQLRKLPDADHRLASQLVRLSRVGCGELGEIAGEIGRDLLMKPAGKGEEVAAVEPRKRVSAETSPSESISSIENTDSDEAEAWFNRGYEQAMAGDLLGAVASYDKALQFQPDFHQAWHNRGVALADLGENEKAIASYDQALQFKPDFHEAWYNRGNALGNLGENEKVIASYDKALKIKPDYHDAWHNRVLALADLGENEKAIASFEKAIQFKPDYHEAYKNKGLALYNLGKYEEAIANYDKAIQIQPDFHEAWYNRGHALAKFGEDKQALESFEQVIQIQPDFHEAWNYQGVILNKLGQYELAIASFDQAIQIKPNNHKAWLNRGDSVSSFQHYNPASATVLQLKFPNVFPILPNPNLTQRGYQGELSSYKEGDRVQWKTPNPDWGVILGRFYEYNHNCNQWTVCYLIQLAPDSPSAAWITADMAWEDDLEKMPDTVAPSQENGNSYRYPSQSHRAIVTPSLHSPRGRYNTHRPHQPRPITQREQSIIDLYCYCQFAMTPRDFYTKWDVTYEQMSHICDRSLGTVQCWFNRGKKHRPPQSVDLRHLAIMDFLLEYFEEIPKKLRTILCFRCS